MTQEKFVSPCPPPTDHQREITTILIEEAAEVQQRATKLLRFGVAEIQPGQPHSNAYRLGLEVGDFLETLDLAIKAGAVDSQGVMMGRHAKQLQLARYVQTEPDKPANAS